MGEEKLKEKFCFSLLSWLFVRNNSAKFYEKSTRWILCYKEFSPGVLSKMPAPSTHIIVAKRRFLW